MGNCSKVTESGKKVNPPRWKSNWRRQQQFSLRHFHRLAKAVQHVSKPFAWFRKGNSFWWRRTFCGQAQHAMVFATMIFSVFCMVLKGGNCWSVAMDMWNNADNKVVWGVNYAWISIYASMCSRMEILRFPVVQSKTSQYWAVVDSSTLLGSSAHSYTFY